MLLFSLCCYHLTNIDGICPEFDEDDEEEKKQKLKYKRLGIGKSEYPKTEYWIGHLFYLITMFLIL